MSRSQQGTVFNTAQGENQTYNANAQSSYGNAQAAEQGFEKQLGKYASENPYTQGGEFQTAVNRQLTNAADAGAQSAGQALQSAAVRTGQNPAGAIAATEAMQQENTRNLGGQEALATQNRIGNEATYNQGVLGETAQPAGFEAQLSGQQAEAAQGALGAQESAAQTPSFLDMLGQGMIQGGQMAGQAAAYGAAAGCWIAAELYGGWGDPRVHAVRGWIFGPFRRRWYGRWLAAAYLRWGERGARAIRRSDWLRRVARLVFDRALEASKWEGR